MTLSVWDMDRTITKVPTFPRWLAFWVRTEAPWRALLLPVVPLLLLLFTVGILDRKRLKEALHWLFLGALVDRARLARAAERFAERVGPRLELSGALAQMRADREAGHVLVLVTASPRYYVEALARRWGVAHVLATENAGAASRLSHRIAGANCYGAEKVRVLNGWRQGRQVARAFSDHVSDLPLLRLAAQPVAVNPTPALAAEAARRGWPIIRWA
jgi:HAD superfamily hydrolase (TIGR01490 family)